MEIRVLEHIETGKTWGGLDESDENILKNASFDTGLSVMRLKRHLDGVIPGLGVGSRLNAAHFRWTTINVDKKKDEDEEDA